MFQFYSADGPKFGEGAGAIERFRARHRRLSRGQQPDTTPNSQVEDLDVEDGRTRKIPAKWRQQQQQQVHVSNQFHGNWADAAGTEMHNAFDFSASPEAFHETEQQQMETKAAPSSQDNQREQDTHDLKSTSLWERRFSRGQSDKPTRQLPTLGHDALWGGPVHYVTQEAQRQALYYQPQYYA